MDPVTQDRTTDPLTEYVHRVVQRVRAFDRRHPLVWDVHLTAFWVTAALIDYLGDGWRNIAHNLGTPGWLVLTMSLGLSVPLLWRRSHPGAAFLATAPFALANAWTGAILQAALLQLLVIFHIALRLPLRTLWWAAAATTAPVVVVAVRYTESEWDQLIVPQVMALTVAAAIGIAVRTRRDYTEALVDRARRLEIERDQQARLATAAERSRIAREMHDIIGHNLSVITGLADGGRYAAAKNPDRAAQALQAIGATSRQALDELRRLLDILDEEQPGEEQDRTPQPTLKDLPSLVEQVRRAGLPVTFTTEGTTDALPPGRQLTVYRVVQEALTNTLKHAGPNATARISLSYDPQGAVTATVTDTGSGGGLPSTAPEGRGLPGMQERTAMYGGTLEAGPRHRPDRGWRVHLHLPEEPAP
ncbi:sensor histidine kinase [Streptomyces sp. NPDC091377]|uniref:sensor histidine kinase n=1 Tax=Streptomyces sp. NPDC091377 TaxID=3365995 RepID=UPI00380B9167